MEDGARTGLAEAATGKAARDPEMPALHLLRTSSTWDAACARGDLDQIPHRKRLWFHRPRRHRADFATPSFLLAAAPARGAMVENELASGEGRWRSKMLSRRGACVTDSRFSKWRGRGSEIELNAGPGTKVLYPLIPHPLPLTEETVSEGARPPPGKTEEPTEKKIQDLALEKGMSRSRRSPDLLFDRLDPRRHLSLYQQWLSRTSAGTSSGSSDDPAGRRCTHGFGCDQPHAMSFAMASWLVSAAARGDPRRGRAFGFLLCKTGAPRWGSASSPSLTGSPRNPASGGIFRGAGLDGIRQGRSSKFAIIWLLSSPAFASSSMRTGCGRAPCSPIPLPSGIAVR